jgi:SpoVK/Ycf46/Vps4 family AAA+-type ATPase
MLTEAQMELAPALQNLLARVNGEARNDFVAPAALTHLAGLFHLTRFESQLLLLAAAPEFDTSFPQQTLASGMSILDDTHWSAVAPGSPLRYWRLIEVGDGSGLMAGPLTADQRIVYFLAGLEVPEERLEPYFQALDESDGLQSEETRRIADRLAFAIEQDALPIVQIQCHDGGLAAALAACNQGGLSVLVLRDAELPAHAPDREQIARLCGREALLTNSAVFAALDGLEPSEMRRVIAFLESLRVPVIVSASERIVTRQRDVLTVELAKPSPTERYSHWRDALGPLAESLNGQLGALAGQFNLSSNAIDHIVRSTPAEPALLWEAARTSARARLNDVAQLIPARATWDDLVLPPEQSGTLRQIAANVRRRFQVYEAWGFASRSPHGSGITALFAGPSGTGKTMAAEVLAEELKLDLFRVDLSSVVSKYIGETEKHLRRIFEAAEESGAILLFDEADALFGKRSEVRDSHDRYANLEVSYLLQRMEAYTGLAILTTNAKQSLDSAFLRRLRFVVAFPFPDAAQRAEIWRRAFPEQTPTEGLDVFKLARLTVAGGNIRNIALNAAFLAADAGQHVQMSHLLDAARSEYLKMERPLVELETGGWLK